MQIRTIIAAGLMAALAIVPSTKASLAIVNGDFEDDPVQTSNVSNWFDTVTANTANWWESTWAGPTVSPNGTSVLGLSYMFTTANWAYQGIGANDTGETALQIQYDIGSFTDAGSTRDLGVTFGVYAADGFAAADNTDIDGVGTLIDSQSALVTLNPGEMLTGQTMTFDITGTTGSNLYLRVINYVGSTGEPWTAIDNIQIIPEPATIGLVGLFGAGLLFVRRRFKI